MEELTRNIKLQGKNIDTIIFSITEIRNLVSDNTHITEEDKDFILDEIRNALYLSLMEKGIQEQY